jgi:hypothetical protein
VNNERDNRGKFTHQNTLIEVFYMKNGPTGLIWYTSTVPGIEVLDHYSYLQHGYGQGRWSGELAPETGSYRTTGIFWRT